MPWFRKNRVSKPLTWPTKSHWFDRELPCPELKNSSYCAVWMPRTYILPIKSTWFGGSCSGLGRSISPEPRRFRVCPSEFPDNFSRQIFWYQKKKILSHLHTAYSGDFSCIFHDISLPRPSDWDPGRMSNLILSGCFADDGPIFCTCVESKKLKNVFVSAYLTSALNYPHCSSLLWPTFDQKVIKEFYDKNH